ncbi:MAG: tRNA 2-thiocytidine biosynthesis protein TtcA [Proteobacteria bacterium]|nr:tRNA 2-thiocytidine biosynthesis protein TtcA [Pseudomonadota bacterium]MBU1057037.1 tRNA 2-thiocytidine biosynthesis protein TtcA [Pseudomonadota bacterium]
MHDYSMLADNDRVLVAVSGGIDSLLLAWLLKHWQRKAPIGYSLHCVHVDMGIWNKEMGIADPLIQVREQIEKIGLSLEVETSLPLSDGSRTCFSCSKLRRKQLFDLARRSKCNKIAFGHHKDDLLETLFLNMLYSGNISTMVPRQELFAGKLSVIRPLAYVEKEEVEVMAKAVGLRPVANLCPLAGDTRREEVKEMLQELYKKIPGAKASLFAALGNVRQEYLL